MVHNITNFKNKSRGFTIVELLVVIVVIGILATITIVSYTGITQKANSTKALSNAQSVLSVAEVFASAENFYPTKTTDLTTGKRIQTTAVTKLAAGVGISTAATDTADPIITASPGLATDKPNPQNGATTIWYQYCGATGAGLSDTGATGGRIQYWDFSTGAMDTDIIYFGTGAATLSAGVCTAWLTPTS